MPFKRAIEKFPKTADSKTTDSLDPQYILKYYYFRYNNLMFKEKGIITTEIHLLYRKDYRYTQVNKERSLNFRTLL